MTKKKAMDAGGWKGSIRSALARIFPALEQPVETEGTQIETSLLLDEYVDVMPSPQNAVDLVPGWKHALPREIDVSAGSLKMYSDPRVTWALEQFGSISGRRILELGPLEASHTYMLHKQGPAVIHAIEANKLSFMRCLIAKNLLGLDSAQFMLGDFHKWLEASRSGTT